MFNPPWIPQVTEIPQFLRLNNSRCTRRSLLSGGGCKTALMTAGERAASGLMGARGSRRPSLGKKRWMDDSDNYGLYECL